jgi:para-nitrobenzyl esterase
MKALFGPRSLELLLSYGFLLAAIPAQADQSQPLVATHEGRIQGFFKNGVAEFFGIPYAEPPVGDLRWRPPREHRPWTGVLKAQSFGPTCAQGEHPVFAGPANNNEDCLYLNIFTPNLSSSARLPVIFWIHGGGNSDGESNDYDGSKLAADGKTVVVTINYRLNLMGFLAHPVLDGEGHFSGNYGILDQQLGLKWVQRNIAKFGGDKNNVTVSGQSAGATDTIANLVSPLAAGLFQRAIVQSGPRYMIDLMPLSSAETKGTNFAVAAGCGSGAGAAIARCLRALTAEQVEALARKYGRVSVVEDGNIVPSSTLSAIKSANFNHVPVMNGTVLDEANFALGNTEYLKNPRVPFTASDFTSLVTATYAGNAGPGGTPPAYPSGTVAKVMALYPLSAYSTPQLAMNTVTTDRGACESLRLSQLLARHVAVYGYEFRDRAAPNYFPPMPGFQALAYHTADIQYLFPLFKGASGTAHSLNEKQAELSRQLVAAWTNFARTGDPNGLGDAPWPRYKGLGGNYLLEDIPALSTLKDTALSAAHKCAFWETIIVYN